MAKRRSATRAQSLQRLPALRGSGGAPATASMAHDAAGNDMAMAGWNPIAASADADLLPDLGTLTARSRDMARNNGVMAGAMQTLRDNIVGATLRLSATPDYRLLGWSREQAREWGNYTEAKFRTWADTSECDAARTLNLLGLTLQALGRLQEAKAHFQQALQQEPDNAWSQSLSWEWSSHKRGTGTRRRSITRRRSCWIPIMLRLGTTTAPFFSARGSSRRPSPASLGR